MIFVIRPATPQDAPAIAHIQISTWHSTYTGIVPDAFLATLNLRAQTAMWQTQLADRNKHTFVAETSQDQTGGLSVFGFASGGPLREPVETYDAELYALYLLRSHQKHGAGRQLTHTLAAALRSAGFRNLLAWVLEANPSVSFYQHLGATQVARKLIQIGDATLPELAFGWPRLDHLS